MVNRCGIRLMLWYAGYYYSKWNGQKKYTMYGDGDFPYGDGLRGRISANLSAFERWTWPDDGLKRAAVAVVVVDDGCGNGAFVLTRRSSRLRTHTGQWALPGGRLEDHEIVTEGVLRELREEVNLSLDGTHVLGALDDYPTRSGYLITPVVMWPGRDAEMSPNPDEVASIRRVSLTELDRSDSPEFLSIPQSDRPVIRMLIHESQVHAPTGAVIYQFREVALHGRDVRVREYEQPVWAWR